MTTKRVLLLIGIASAVLLIVGFVIGAVGSKMFGLEKPFVSQPGIHLPPDPVFPAAVRQDVVGYRVAEKKDEAKEDQGASAGEDEHKEEHHGLGLMQFAVTNTMLSAWLTSIIMLVFFIGGARNPKVIPSRLQALIEMLFELVLNFASSILGPEMGRRAFPVVATIFFFVLFNAWIAIFLIPIYQAVGYGANVGGEFKLATHLVRPAGTDLNMPLALALVSFVFVEYWGFRAHSFGYLKKFFAFGDILRGRPSGLINVFVGLLELVSELVRIVSFTFRLFGNMTAGEILVVMITFLVPFVATQFVFGLELLVGLIQSVIFAGLTLVFLSVAVSHEEH
ncbi:MAG: F0F1 ATP synthase subunit A [Chloroflexota bacterium]|nr:F0F1 ATP synthase subunit A [Chloroflexota bacterium]MDE2685256.1 F0F1 ATP synthase subunit A [Chloroflexota bacterium]